MDPFLLNKVVQKLMLSKNVYDKELKSKFWKNKDQNYRQIKSIKLFFNSLFLNHGTTLFAPVILYLLDLSQFERFLSNWVNCQAIDYFVIKGKRNLGLKKNKKTKQATTTLKKMVPEVSERDLTSAGGQKAPKSPAQWGQNLNEIS